MQIDFAFQRQDIRTVLTRHRSGWCSVSFHSTISIVDASPSGRIHYGFRIWKKLGLTFSKSTIIRLWYAEPNAISNAIDYAKFYSRSHHAVIRVYDEADNVIETHEHAGDFREW